jgi:hypothetical protein
MASEMGVISVGTRNSSVSKPMVPTNKVVSRERGWTVREQRSEKTGRAKRTRTCQQEYDCKRSEKAGEEEVLYRETGCRI